MEPSLVLLRLYHMHHAAVIMSSTKSFPMCCTKIRYQRRSIKSLKLTPLASKDIPVANHTSCALVQSQNKCPLVSSTQSHALQVALSITPRRQRFTFVGRMWRLAFHAKVISLLGISRLQIFTKTVSSYHWSRHPPWWYLVA